MGTGASVLFSTRPVVVQGPKDRLTSTGSGLSLLPSLQLGLHPKDRLKGRNTDSRRWRLKSLVDGTDPRLESPVAF